MTAAPGSLSKLLRELNAADAAVIDAAEHYGSQVECSQLDCVHNSCKLARAVRARAALLAPPEPETRRFTIVAEKRVTAERREICVCDDSRLFSHKFDTENDAEHWVVVSVEPQ